MLTFIYIYFAKRAHGISVLKKTVPGKREVRKHLSSCMEGWEHGRSFKDNVAMQSHTLRLRTLCEHNLTSLSYKINDKYGSLTIAPVLHAEMVPESENSTFLSILYLHTMEKLVPDISTCSLWKACSEQSFAAFHAEMVTSNLCLHFIQRWFAVIHR